MILENLCTDYKIYESIFYHLIQNAIKYSPTEGKIKVECSFRHYDKPGSDLSGHLVTKITD